jgi:hypothetical protein
MTVRPLPREGEGLQLFGHRSWVRNAREIVPGFWLVEVTGGRTGRVFSAQIWREAVASDGWNANGWVPHMTVQKKYGYDKGKYALWSWSMLPTDPYLRLDILFASEEDAVRNMIKLVELWYGPKNEG